MPLPRLTGLERQKIIDEAAEIDSRAFPTPWANNAAALRDIITATPRYRARCIHLDGRMVAFSISGRASTLGYVQRLAPAHGLRVALAGCRQRARAATAEAPRPAAQPESQSGPLERRGECGVRQRR